MAGHPGMQTLEPVTDLGVLMCFGDFLATKEELLLLRAFSKEKPQGF